MGQEFLTALELLRPLYGRVHLTGGEPLLYQNLNRLLDILQDFGFQTAITTNGLFSIDTCLPVLKRLEYVNVSVHSFQKRYVERLVGKWQDPEKTIAVIIQNLETLSQMMPVRINTLVSENRELQAIEEVLEFAAAHRIELKLVPEWSVRAAAERNIRSFLKKNGFQLYETLYLRPGSNVRERYRNPSGQIVEVKRIDFFQPDFMCEGCGERDRCQEGFSFLRLGGDPLYFQPCIFRGKVGLDEFRQTVLPNLYKIFEEITEPCAGCAADRE